MAPPAVALQEPAGVVGQAVVLPALLFAVRRVRALLGPHHGQLLLDGGAHRGAVGRRRRHTEGRTGLGSCPFLTTSKNGTGLPNRAIHGPNLKLDSLQSKEVSSCRTMYFWE